MYIIGEFSKLKFLGNFKLDGIHGWSSLAASWETQRYIIGILTQQNILSV